MKRSWKKTVNIQGPKRDTSVDVTGVCGHPSHLLIPLYGRWKYTLASGLASRGTNQTVLMYHLEKHRGVLFVRCQKPGCFITVDSW